MAVLPSVLQRQRRNGEIKSKQTPPRPSARWTFRRPATRKDLAQEERLTPSSSYRIMRVSWRLASTLRSRMYSVRKGALCVWGLQTECVKAHLVLIEKPWPSTFQKDPVMWMWRRANSQSINFYATSVFFFLFFFKKSCCLHSSTT